MPIIVACPQCQGQLRVADDLIGRKVRCPACNTTFDANAPASSPTPEPRNLPLEPNAPVATEKLDPWKHLNLELTDDPAPPPLPPAPPRGARELDPDPEPAPLPNPRRARLNDDHDDLRPCPSCGRMVHRDARRCLGCRAQLRIDPDEEYDDRPLPARRDCEPHRGNFILTMGILGLAPVIPCFPLAVLAIVPALLAWILGGGDLRKIRRGDMDPEGESSTQAGWICGIVGTVLNVVILVGCGGFCGIGWYASIQESKKQPRPVFVPPPGRAK